MYRVRITGLIYKHVKPLEDAFNDREIEIKSYRTSISYSTSRLDEYEVIISNIHTVTMTPLMWWILHHIDRSDYHEITIS